MESLRMEDNEEFRATLSSFQRKGLLTDVCLLCDGGEIIKIHKLILASCSQYFFDIFTTERESNAIDAVGLQGVKSSAMQALIDFIYKGTLDFTDGNAKRFWSVLTLAYKFKMKPSYRLLKTKFSELVQPRNFFEFWCLVAKADMKDFQDILNNYLISNSEKICNSPEFLNMNLEQIYPIFKKCSQESLPQPILKNCIQAWMNYRRMNKCDILETILLGDKNIFTSPEKEDELDNFEKNTENKQGDFNLKDTIFPEANGKNLVTIIQHQTTENLLPMPYSLKTNLPSKLDFQQELEWVNSMLSKELEEKEGNQLQCILKIPESAVFMDLLTPPYLVMIATDSTRNIPYFIHYSIDDNKWSSPIELDITFNQKSTMYYHNKCVYSVGGLDEKLNVLDECYKYDIGTKIIKKLPGLRTPRSETKLECLDNKLFVLGGKGKCHSALRLVECLDLKEGNSWTIFQAMRSPHEATAASLTTKDHIFVLGGGTNICEYYDHSIETWNKLPSLPEELIHQQIFAAISSGQLVILRSFAPSKVYCLRNQNWQSINAKGFPPDNILQVANVIDTIFALTPCSLIFVFNLHSCSWSVLTKVPRLWGNYLYFALQN